MALTVPPLPIQSRVSSENGFMSEAWVKFITLLWRRAGGEVALTNIELANQQQADLTAINADITALESLTTTHTAQIAAINTALDELRQGPNL